jgi:hypothetical protein
MFITLGIILRVPLVVWRSAGQEREQCRLVVCLGGAPDDLYLTLPHIVG